MRQEHEGKNRSNSNSWFQLNLVAHYPRICFAADDSTGASTSMTSCRAPRDNAQKEADKDDKKIEWDDADKVLEKVVAGFKNRVIFQIATTMKSWCPQS